MEAELKRLTSDLKEVTREVKETRDSHQETKFTVDSLKLNIADILEAIKGQSILQGELIKKLDSYTTAIDTERVRKSENEKLTSLEKQVASKRVDAIDIKIAVMESFKPAVERVIRSQKRWDKFVNAMFSDGGKVVLGLIFIAILYFLGINPSDFKN